MAQRSRRPPRVIHVGSGGTLVRDAVATAATLAESVSVVSVAADGGPSSDIPAEAVRLLVAGPDSETEHLAALRAAFPSAPTLAMVDDPSDVDVALSGGATDVLIRREGADEVAALARRIDGLLAGRDRESMESTEAVVNAIEDLFYRLDTEGYLQDWNEHFRTLTGYDDTELAGMHALEFFAAADCDRIADAIGRALETGSATVEADILAKDGRRIPVEFTGALISGPDGEPRGVTGIGRELTERDERERRLRRLRQAVETITDSAPLSLVEVGADGTLLTVQGETIPSRLDLPSTDGQSVETFFAEFPTIREVFDRAVEGETTHRLVEAADATLELWSQPLSDRTDEVERVVGLLMDVTEREAQAKLLDQIRRNAGEVIWMSTPGKESMDFITDSYRDIWGREPEQLLADPLSFVDAVHPADRDRVEAALDRQQKDPDDYEETYRIIQPDGTVRWVHDRAAGVYEDGDLTRIVGIATDITERRERAQELELKDRAIETAPVGIAIHDATGSDRPTVYVNDAFRTVTGYELDSLEEEWLLTLVGPETDDERVERLRSALADGAEQSVVVLLYRADGTPFWGRISVAPVFDDGETTHLVTFLQDITESKEHEQEIERHLAEFGDLLADDLGVPLREARRHLGSPDRDDSEADVAAAAQSIERAVSLVEDLTTIHSRSVKPRTVSESMRTDTDDA